MAELTVAEWTDVFAELYEDKDKPRSPADLWTAAYAHFSSMGEHIRRMHFSGLLNTSATHAFCWLCSFFVACQKRETGVFRLQEPSLSDVVALKYPGRCGHCEAIPCKCEPREADATPAKAARYDRLLKFRHDHTDWSNYTLSQWQETFENVYGQQIHMLPLEAIGFHFLEEAGETALAIRSLQQLAGSPDRVEGVDGGFVEKLSTVKGTVELYTEYKDMKVRFDSEEPPDVRNRLVKAKMDLIVELGDTLSWFCSVLNKVRSIGQNCDSGCEYAHRLFADRLLKEYVPNGKSECPTCHAPKCKCHFVQGGDG